MQNTDRTNYYKFSVPLLILLHLVVAMPFAIYLNIWTDEASSLYATQQGLSVAFQTAVIEQKQAPLYFWVLSIWRQLSESIFFARCLSLVCSIASIWLFARLADRLLTQKAAFLATAFFALHPFLLWAGLEIRVYSLMILLSLGLIYTFLDGFWEDLDAKIFPIARFAIVATIALYTNYYLGFMLVGFLIPLVIFRRWNCALKYLGTMAIVGLAFLPMALFVQAEMHARSSVFIEERSVITGIKLLWNHALTYLLPTEIFPTGTTSLPSIWRLWLVRALLVVIVGLVIVRRRLISKETVMLGAIVATILGFLLIAYFIVGSWLIAIRHASLLFPPLILVFASLLNDLVGEGTNDRRIFRIATPVFAMIVLAGFAYTTANLYPNFVKRGDWERVGRYIENNETPNQPIVVFHTYDALSLPYYYHGKNRILPDERYFEFDFGTPTPSFVARRTEFTLSKMPLDAPEIWLLLNDECNMAGICEAFEEFIAAKYDVVSEQRFYGQRVLLLRKKK